MASPNKINKDLRSELSHVCWLLSQECNTDDKYTTLDEVCTYYSDMVYNYGIPEVEKVWDHYYEGWWIKLIWKDYDHVEWIWHAYSKNEDTKKCDVCNFKDFVNDVYWWNIENKEPQTECYIWDEYYKGWWLYSEWNEYKKSVEWIWMGE